MDLLHVYALCLLQCLLTLPDPSTEVWTIPTTYIPTGDWTPNDEPFTPLIKEHTEKCPSRSCQPRNTANRCCGYCSCGSDCEVYGSCCLGAYASFSNAANTVANSTYECVLPQYILEGSRYNAKDSLWMVTKCRSLAMDDINIDLCYNPGEQASVDSLVPVTDLTSMIHYRNKFCAYCNGVEYDQYLVRWKLEIYNDNYIRMPDKEFLSKLRQESGNILFQPPAFITTKRCTFPPYHISECNVTGKWSIYDEEVARACASFVDPFNYTYKNYFCYKCNSAAPDLPPANLTCIGGKGDITDISPPFFAILDVAETVEEDKEELVCDVTQFTDYKKIVCRDIYCHQSRTLIRGKCVTDYMTEKEICYDISLKMTWLSNSRPLLLADMVFFRQEDVLKKTLAKRIPDFNKIVTATRVFVSANARSQIKGLVIYLVIHIKQGSPRHSSKYVDSLMSLDETVISFDISSLTLSSDFQVKTGLYNITNYNDGFSDAHVFNERTLSVDIFPLLFKNDLSVNMCLEKIVALTKLHVCPFIKLDMNELSFQFQNDLLIIDEGSGSNKGNTVLTKWSYEIYGQKIHICLDDFIQIYENIEAAQSIQNLPSTSTSVEAKRILSFICVCISIICLMVTIVTYLRFSVLQSQPGMNNIILCVSLLLAQVMYQFGAGQRSVSDWACSVIGAVCHFLWLSVFFSMNACCLHMFSIFKRHRKIFPKFSFRRTLRNILCVIGLSVLFVAINFIVSFSIKNDNSGGYGGNVCFISSNDMQIVTFIFPAAATLSINILLFSYVIFRLLKTSHEATQLNQERNYFLIYARLSTLTGLTWIFGFIQVFANLEVFEYIFILLNASQGAFIMTAFVLNKRIYFLWCAKDKTSSSSVWNKHTLSTSVAEPVKQTENEG